MDNTQQQMNIATNRMDVTMRSNSNDDKMNSFKGIKHEKNASDIRTAQAVKIVKNTDSQTKLWNLTETIEKLSQSEQQVHPCGINATFNRVIARVKKQTVQQTGQDVDIAFERMIVARASQASYFNAEDISSKYQKVIMRRLSNHFHDNSLPYPMTVHMSLIAGVGLDTTPAYIVRSKKRRYQVEVEILTRRSVDESETTEEPLKKKKQYFGYCVNCAPEGMISSGFRKIPGR
jgi:hypothetical protein